MSSPPPPAARFTALVCALLVFLAHAVLVPAHLLGHHVGPEEQAHSAAHAAGLHAEGERHHHGGHGHEGHGHHGPADAGHAPGHHHEHDGGDHTGVGHLLEASPYPYGADAEPGAALAALPPQGDPESSAPRLAGVVQLPPEAVPRPPPRPRAPARAPPIG